MLVPPRGSDALANGIPGASVLDLRSAGHGVAAEEAARVNAALRAHFQQADAAQAQRAPTPHQEERAS
jgi:pimeloyl-ACP methyl ester carboxylesterase